MLTFEKYLPAITAVKGYVLPRFSKVNLLLNPLYTMTTVLTFEKYLPAMTAVKGYVPPTPTHRETERQRNRGTGRQRIRETER